MPELGLYHYKARMYSPILGRFMQTDPIGYEDQMNLYAYVGNDPVNGIDPTGLKLCGVGVVGDSDGPDAVPIRECGGDEPEDEPKPAIPSMFDFTLGAAALPRSPQSGRCPASGVFTVGASGDLFVAGAGGALNGGLSTNNYLDSELYGSYSAGFGFDVGAGLEFGYFPGGHSSLKGEFTEIEINIGIADIGFSFSGDDYLGSTVTIGPQAPGISVSSGHGVVTDLDPQC